MLEVSLASMIKYSPFLKLKSNEAKALESLQKEVSIYVRPLFDIPRTSKIQTEQGIIKRIEMGFKSITELYRKQPIEFYLDNNDIDDDITLSGSNQYEYILLKFSEFKPIPVLALDRNSNHNIAALSHLSEHGGKIAIRLQKEDLESYKLTKPEIVNLYSKINKTQTTEIHILLDLRLIDNVDTDHSLVEKFLSQFVVDFAFDTIISAGSIIPSNISTLISTNKISHKPRNEKLVWRKLLPRFNIQFGDYGVVSPDYSDADLDPKLLRLVSTPKVFYTYLDNFYILRGSSLHTHPRGNNQFFDIADKIVPEVFFRDPTYSDGDKYIHDRSYLSLKRPPKAGSQGSWIKGMLSSHITYIVNNI